MIANQYFPLSIDVQKILVKHSDDDNVNFRIKNNGMQ